MLNSASEVIRFIDENDVKFIRLTFCDIFGIQKNISIMPSELERAFKYGISFDASAVSGFNDITESDLFLFPEPQTLAFLPWRPSHGRVVRLFCTIKYPDGRLFEGDSRNILKNAVKVIEQAGFGCDIEPECEFYLFKNDEDGNPNEVPFDNATYMDIAPKDKGENVRREICLMLEAMGITPKKSHHEQGPGQNEIDFKYSDALMAADNFIAFKTVVNTVAAQNGIYASFMPKPIPDKAGNGLHINYSLTKNGKNLFGSNENQYFTAGIMNRIAEMTAFFNPMHTSYERLGSFEAPRYVTWSCQNRSQLVRIPASSDEYSRTELRSPDPMLNPYLAFALLIYAGVEGIKNKETLCEPTNINLFAADDKTTKSLKQLPSSLVDAIGEAEKSEFINKTLPKKTIECYLKTKKQMKSIPRI
ncbi:MAG: hypothetical protein A2Y17_10020 [Clostridiales bacterium GWF2_38_85]|nr:MAG: hypothetical protein A2Y17_10020 [Clostridiales bacterium GWF2_38_85]HBL84453.1 hypothetical protein [Clostridiales bacterium]